MLHSCNATQNVIKIGNGRQRARVKHFIKQVQGMINIPKASRFALISNRFQEMILIQIVIRVFFSTSNTSSSSNSKRRITMRTKTSVGRTKKRTHFPEDPANNSAAEIRTKRQSLRIEKERDRNRESVRFGSGWSVLRAVYWN